MQTNDLEKLQAQVQEKSRFIGTLRTEFSRIVAGQEHLIDRLLLALITDGHVLIEGVPGLAKTLAVKTLAQTLDGSFSRIQFTPDLLPADLIGTRIYEAEKHDFSTRLGPVFANIVLADEINRAPAKVQSALLESMQEHQITIAGTAHKLPSPFLVMATQNPIEQEGTYPLPEAQIDRFMFKLKVLYPTRPEEHMIIERMAHPGCSPKALAVSKLEDILAARECMDRIYLDDKIVEYILDLVIATRPTESAQLSARQKDTDLGWMTGLVDYGASPRSSIALALAAKGAAFMAGRAYVVPQDVKDVALDVLRHRVVVSYEAEAENLDSDAVVSRLLNELRTP